MVVTYHFIHGWAKFLIADNLKESGYLFRGNGADEEEELWHENVVWLCLFYAGFDYL